MSETSAHISDFEEHDDNAMHHRAHKANHAHHDDDEHEGHGHEEGEPWLMSFADLILNLLLFFIVLYSISSVDEKKLQELAKAINGEIVPQTITEKAEDEEENAEILQEIQSLMNKINDGVATDQQKKKAEIVKEQLGKYLKIAPGKDPENDLFEIILSGEKYFKAGSAGLNPNTIEAIQAFAERIRPIQTDVGLYIEGHSDPQEFSNNFKGLEWQIASERAANVLIELKKRGVRVKSASTVGYGADVDLTSDKTNFESRETKVAKSTKTAGLNRARVHLRVVREVKSP